MITIEKYSMVFLISVFACFICYGRLKQPHDVSFKSELDGSKQYYMEILPVDFDKDKKHDLIIGLHGHGSDRKQFAFSKRSECTSFRKFAAKYNMIVITPDYRAKTSWMGPAAEADLVQIIKELKAKYKINKVFLVGGSMGATSALTFAAIHPEMIDGVTSMNGHANHLEYNNFQDAISKSFGGAKDKIPLEYKKRSAEYWPERLTMPIAFTVGGKDTSVPQNSVLRLAKVLKKLKRKVMLIKRPQVGHSTNFEDGMVAMEFMVSGTKPKILAKPKAVSETSSASVPVVKAKAQSGRGGIFFAQDQPVAKDAKGKVELGLKFYVEKPGKIEAFCFYQAKSEKGQHILRLWNTNGELLFAVNANAVEKSGWVNVPLTKAFAVSTSTEYIVSYTCNKAYPATPNFFKSPVKKDGVMAIAGVYSFKDLGEKVPKKTYKKMNYFIDLIFSCED